MATPVVTPPSEGLPPVKGAEKDPQLEAMRAELSRLVGKVEGVERKVAQPAAPPAASPSPGAPPSKKELNAKFYEDPVSNVATIAASVVQNLRAAEGAMSYDTLVAVAKDQVRKSSPELWDKYAGEIEALVMESTAQAPLARQNVFVWQNAFKQVKGDHLDEIVNEAKKEPVGNGKSPALHISNDGGPAGVSRTPPAPSQTKLTEDEARVARGLGISAEQYLQGRADYESQTHNVKQPSSWDKHVTFSTRERMRQERAKRAAATK